MLVLCNVLILERFDLNLAKRISGFDNLNQLLDRIFARFTTKIVNLVQIPVVQVEASWMSEERSHLLWLMLFLRIDLEHSAWSVD